MREVAEELMEKVETLREGGRKGEWRREKIKGGLAGKKMLPNKNAKSFSQGFVLSVCLYFYVCLFIHLSIYLYVSMYSYPHSTPLYSAAFTSIPPSFMATLLVEDTWQHCTCLPIRCVHLVALKSLFIYSTLLQNFFKKLHSHINQ